VLTSRLTIVNRLGLHARAAAKFVACASHYESRIRVAKDGHWVDAKSIMGVMMLAAGKGSELDVELDGRDETEALAALEALVADYFGEGG
jgi:phosphocarrier protein